MQRATTLLTGIQNGTMECAWWNVRLGTFHRLEDHLENAVVRMCITSTDAGIVAVQERNTYLYQ